MGTDFPLRFQISILVMFSGFHFSAWYTSLNRWRQLARSSSRLTYSTRPLAHSQPSHFPPSAIAIHSSASRYDFPALEGPAISILWPFLSTFSIKHGASSGMLSQASARFSGSGSPSYSFSIHDTHSSQLLLPMFTAIRRCSFPARITPGILDSLEGFLFCLSTSRPFSVQNL